MEQLINKQDELVINFFKDYEKHRDAIKYYITKAIELKSVSLQEYIQLKQRAMRHDRSKEYNFEEFSAYIKMSKELEPFKYGSKEYFDIRDKYKYATDLHYKNNDHHPEHFKNGILDMDRVQIIEMVCDWCASMKCRNNIDKYKESVELNKKRFNIPNDIYTKIFNLVEYLLKE